MTLTIYEFDQNRVFTGQFRQPGPRDPIPRNWTHIAPPEGEGYHIFDGVKWFTRAEYPHPIVPDVPPAPRHITRLAFLTRFTDAEAVAIDLASLGPTPEAAMIRRYLSKIESATFIDLDRDDLRAGVMAIEAAGLLAEGRALEVLDTPIDEVEVPR